MYYLSLSKCISPDYHDYIQQDYTETQMLLSTENVNQEALLCYAREAADFGTNYQLPTLDFAMNHCGQPDVAMFDFTSMHASENAALVRERFGHQLLVTLVGDSLLEVRNNEMCQVSEGVESELKKKTIWQPWLWGPFSSQQMLWDK